MPKRSSVPRKKTPHPAKVGAKCKLSEDSNSDSSDEEEIVPKKSSCAKVQHKEKHIEQKPIVVESRSGRSKLRKKAKDQSDGDTDGSKGKKKAKKKTKSEPKSFVGSVISHDQLKRKLQEDSNIEVMSKKHKKTMYGKRDVPSVEAVGSLGRNDERFYVPLPQQTQLPCLSMNSMLLLIL